MGSPPLVQDPAGAPRLQARVRQALLIVALAAAFALQSLTVRAAPVTHFLHAAAATVGSSTFNTLTTGAAAGTQATFSAGLGNRGVDTVLQSAGGVTVFVSDAVPSGQQWDIGGSWTCSLYVRGTVATRIFLRARMYRVSSTGALTEVGATPLTSRRDISTSFGLQSWTFALGSQTLAAGERFGVRLYINPDEGGLAGQSVLLAFDSAAQASSVIVPLTVTTLTAVPGPPQSVAAAAGDTTAAVTWAAPTSDGGSPITAYTVTSAPGGFVVTTDGSTLLANFTGLANGVSYTFTVKATNAIGQGPASAPSNAVTPGTLGPPGPPVNVSAVAGDQSATVSWGPPADTGGTPITGYRVVATPGGNAVDAGRNSGSAVVGGLQNGISYTFEVFAQNNIGFGPPSQPSNAVTPGGTAPPSEPLQVAATAGNTSATVTWAAPLTAGGSPIVRYTVISAPGGVTVQTADGVTLATVVPGLTNGVTYTFTVTATNANATGPASVPSNAVTPGTELLLHAADVAVGSQVFNTMNTAPLAGTLATGSASLAVRGADVEFVDGAGIGLFASDPVPLTKTWSLGGAWAFRAYVRTSSSQRFYVRARIYRITAAGASTELSSTPLTSRIDGTTTFAAVNWSFAMPAVTLNGGERFGVRFYANSDSDAPGLSAILGFDHNTAPSSVTPTVVQADAPGRVREAHFRIGMDTPLDAMQWFGSADSGISNFAKEQRFRVRFQVYNDGAAGVSWTPRLEWSTQPDSGFSAVATAPGSAPFFVSPTSAFADGAAIGTAAFGMGQGFGTAVTGIAYDASNPPPAGLSLAGSSHTEVEFSVEILVSAVDGQAYYFRLTNSGTALATFDSGSAFLITEFPWPAPPTPTPPAHNGNLQYTASTSACAGCHRGHTSPAPSVLYKAWPEEGVCFTCHNGSTTAPNIQNEFAKAFRMPITATTGVHTKNEPRTKSPTLFTGVNRHVECADCHNPHFAGRGNHDIGTNYAAGPQQGVWGIGVTNQAAWSAPALAPVTQVEFQYQLCFKCHSSWAYGTSPPPSPSGGFAETDQSKEFNTLNPAYHPVEDVGKNPFVKPNGASYASSLINGFTPTSRMVCADCHTTGTAGAPAGPHGSNSPFILKGDWDRSTGTSGTQNDLCFSCHAFSTYGEGANKDDPSVTGFSGEGKNLHAVMVGARNKAFNDAPIGCQDCHVAIPHGYLRDHLIGFTGDGAPYVNRPYSGGLIQIDIWRASGQWTFSSCSTAMNSCK